MNVVTEEFAQTIVSTYGSNGSDWLARLPAIIAGCERRWTLEALTPFAPLSYNYVAPAVRSDGTHVVLKAGVPHDELWSEMAVLGLYGGQGCVQLLEADHEQGVMLLERLSPSVPLSTLEDDEEATVIAAEVMRSLVRPAPANHEFPTVGDLMGGLTRLRDRFEAGTGPFPAGLVDAAERLASELGAATDEPVLLHGDLHQDNILSATRSPWLAIDPKGVVGDPAYEPAAFLRNRLVGTPDPGKLLARRVDRFADALDFERERIAGWGLAHAVLSAWWSYEDHGEGWEPALACAELLARQLRVAY